VTASGWCTDGDPTEANLIGAENINQTKPVPVYGRRAKSRGGRGRGRGESTADVAIVRAGGAARASASSRNKECGLQPRTD